MWSIGIRQQLLIFALLPLLVVIAGSGLFVLYNYHTEVDVLQERQTLRAARILARLAAPALMSVDDAPLQQLLDSVIDQDICGVSLLAPDNTLLASSGKPGPISATADSVWWQDGTLSARWPIYRYSHTSHALPEDSAAPLLGWVVVNSNQESVTQYRYETISASLVWILLALLLVSFLGANISRRLNQRMTQLRATLARLDSHDWSTRLQPSSNPDWQSLTSVINELSQRAQQQLRHLQNQVDHSHQDLQYTLESLEISNIELELARKEALSASQSKSDFLANTSHEVRTPLTGILGFCKVLLQSENNPRKREYLETIRRSAEHLLGILNDVLDLSKIEAGKFSLDHSPFDLLPVVEDSVCLFAYQAADKDIDLIIEAVEPLPNTVRGDAARLKQLIANLVSNAVKFTDRGQVLVRLATRIAGGRQMELNIDIEDSGIGIDAKEQKRLFKAFQQLDSSPTRPQGGTGLGLAIVKNLVKQMNGSISVTSEKHHGTTFSLTLPLDCEADSSRKPHARLAYKRALLWERNPDNRRALSHRLLTHGIAVEYVDTVNGHPQLPPLDDGCQLILSLRDESELGYFETLPAGRTCILLPTLSGVLSRTDYNFVQKPITEAQLLAQFQPTGELPSPTNNLLPENRADLASALVVDDNANNRLLLQVLFEELGAPSELHSNGADARARAEENHYPLIILDLQMPGMSGSDLASAIRRTQLNTNSHIVALTAHGSRDTIDSELLHHFDEFLTKPLSLDMLAGLLKYCRRESHPPVVPSKPVCLKECLNKSDQRSELAQRLLEKFLDGLPECRRQWLQAKMTDETEQVRDLSHQLQGACAYVGAPQLAAALLSLQTSLAKGAQWHIPSAEIEAVIAEIDQLIDWRDQHDLDVLFESSAPIL